MIPNTPSASAKINFEKSGYFFLALIPLVFLGFWNTYFSKFFISDISFSFYFHVHAILMAMWVALLIVQPILIKKKKLRIHQLNGKVSYFIMPLILISIVLMIHNGGKSRSIEEQTFAYSILPIMLFLIVSTFYLVAILYRHDVNIHARAMIATGISFLDPTLMRFIGPPSIIIILGTVITLIVLERKQKKGRWIFPSLLGALAVMYIPVLIYVFSNTFISIPPLDSLMRWFYRLPLS